MHIPDEVNKCVVLIGMTAPASTAPYKMEDVYAGTAFLVQVPVGDRHSVVYLVTAAHVAKGIEGNNLWVRANTTYGKSVKVSVQGTHWWGHPTESDVDVVITPWAPPHHIDHTRIRIQDFATPETMQEQGISTGDEVFLTGLSPREEGDAKNAPLVRAGSIAMIPEDKIRSGNLLMDAYLIEALSITGLGGSPVFVRQALDEPEDAEAADAKPVAKGRRPFSLLGLMHGQWEVGDAKLTDLEYPVTADSSSGQGVHMGIGVVVPAYKIMEVLNHPELKGRREAAVAEFERQEKKNSTRSGY